MTATPSILATMDKPDDIESPVAFLEAYVWAVVRSGMGEREAVALMPEIMPRAKRCMDVSEVFPCRRKAVEIRSVALNRIDLFTAYSGASDRRSFLLGLPLIGPAALGHFLWWIDSGRTRVRSMPWFR